MNLRPLQKQRVTLRAQRQLPLSIPNRRNGRLPAARAMLRFLPFLNYVCTVFHFLRPYHSLLPVT